ncbi:MAG: TldD/PmbA family protein [Fibrobacteraceae bacterium]|nr:TldD/PmbA family protein [Fibrobacteraceae bacterium]
MNIQDAVSYMCERAKKMAQQFDIIAATSHSEGLSVFQGQVQNTEISDSVGLGIRVLKDGCPGYAHTERLTKDAIEQTLKDALCHTQWTEKIDVQLPSSLNLSDQGFNYNANLENLTLSQMKDFCIDLEKAVFQKSSEIENIPYLGADMSSSCSIVANHTGLFYETRANSASVGAGAVASRNGVKKLGNYVKNGRDFAQFSIEEISSKTAEYAVELFGAKKIEGGKMPVVFSERISPKLMGMYCQPFVAEAMQKGMSRLQGKEGEVIASKEFSLWNDPLGENFMHRFLFDSEGSPTRLVKVVDQGVFSEALYNLETASKAGRKTTGNGARTFDSKVYTGFYNLLVPASDKSIAELLKLFPKCFYVVRLEGNSGCNAVSGEFSIGAHGFWVENGVVQHPVDGATLNGNFFDIIKDIVAVGNEYRDAFASHKVPALAVSELSVSV